MGKKTALYDVHCELGAKIVDFGGWDMPLHYGSQVEEHHQVRQHCGMFDVSHMAVVDVAGAGARAYLQHVLANDVDKLKAPGKALYSVMLNPRGGVIDDLIVYRLNERDYRLVVNAGTAEKDIAWMQEQVADFDVSLSPRTELGIIAVQGPKALELTRSVVCDNAVAAIDQLQPFEGQQVGSWFIARTGYTGEDGLEIILPSASLADLWGRLLEVGVHPAGLGARDTLRLEAGMNLYGNEMDEDTSPLEANLAWTLAFTPGRDFIGREALEAQRSAGVGFRLVGLVLETKGVLRSHLPVKLSDSDVLGETTSGSFSPTLSRAIALARVPVGSGENAEVEIRGKWLPVKIVKPCFVRHGKQVY